MLGNERLENSVVERDLRVLVNDKLNMSQQCPGSQEGQPCPGGHQAKHLHLVKGGDCPALLCTGVASPCVQFQALQYKKDIKLLESVQRRAVKIVKGQEGKVYEEQQTTWSVQPGEEETEERPHCGL
ncbi:hypothetical protein BTVI_15914 [Pitangus sulphuratus]|nr:hypothetical protein BTVI_15914 [Pitangus sulphuratus]